MQTKPYLHKAHYYETDQMGIIHHANYIRWMEEARVDYMDQIGFSYDRAEKLGVSFAVIGINCDYKQMVRFNDTVAIDCAFTSYTGVKMTVAYQMADAHSGALFLTGESRHCFLNREGRPVHLRKILPELDALFGSLAQR